MDVSEARARREIEAAQRYLREREEEHARELEGMHRKQEEQLEELQETQTENIKDVQTDAEEELQKARQNFQEQYQDVTDTFERTLTEERKDHYNQFGKLKSEYAQERAQERQKYTKQIENLVESHQKNSEISRNHQDKRLREMWREFEKDKHTLKNHYENKIQEQSSDHTEALAKAAVRARQKVDDQTRRLHKDLSDEKIGSKLRYKKLVEESQAERHSLKDALNLRENQLIEEKSQVHREAQKKAAQLSHEQQLRTNDTIERLIDDNHQLNRKKDREYTNSLNKLQHKHHSEKQGLISKFREIKGGLRDQLETEKHAQTLKEALNERRRKQAAHLEAETIRKNANLTREIMADNHSQMIREMEQKNRDQIREVASEMRKRMLEQDLRSQSEQELLNLDKMQSAAEQEMKHEHEKASLIREYQNRQKSLDALRNRQIQDQKNYYGKVVADTKNEAEQQIYTNSREKQKEVFLLKERLKNTAQEYEATRKSEKNYQDSLLRSRLKRLTENYNRSLNTQQRSFEEATSELRHENSIQMTKLLNDAEHKRRMQLIELQAKNRSMTTSYESQLNRMNDEHEAELSRIKDEHRKEMRTALKRTKETIDKERAYHARMMEAKELQMEQRLKLQEEAFRKQIENLKQSHELALKKS